MHRFAKDSDAHEPVGQMTIPSNVTAGVVIAARNLSVSYGSTTALRAVNFHAGQGELIAVVGPNGAGKSSLMKALVGLVHHGGDVALHGQNCHHGMHRHSVAYIPQRLDLDMDFPITAAAVVASGRRRFRRSWQRLGVVDRTSVVDALERVGAAHLAKRRISALSGGEFQRILLARALAQEADVLLLDESLSGVDQPTASALVDVLAGLATSGTTSTDESPSRNSRSVPPTPSNRRVSRHHLDPAWIVSTCREHSSGSHRSRVGPILIRKMLFLASNGLASRPSFVELVLAPVVLVPVVAVFIVEVVDVVVMGNGGVPATLAVLMVVVVVRHMLSQRALVVVAVVGPVYMTVVEVVGMVAVNDGDVAASVGMDMGVFSVGDARGAHE